MDMRLYCRSWKTGARRRLIVRRDNAAAGKKALQFFEELELAFGLQFLAQRIERQSSETFRPAQFE